MNRYVVQFGKSNRSAAAGDYNITLPIPMKNTNYYANSTIAAMNANSDNDSSPGTKIISNTTIAHYASRTYFTNPVLWEAKGQTN